MSIMLTERAASHVKRFLETKGEGIGLRLGVKPTGCSGYAYQIEAAESVAAYGVAFQVVMQRGIVGIPAHEMVGHPRETRHLQHCAKVIAAGPCGALSEQRSAPLADEIAAIKKRATIEAR